MLLNFKIKENIQHYTLAFISLITRFRSTILKVHSSESHHKADLNPNPNPNLNLHVSTVARICTMDFQNSGPLE